MLIDNRLRWPGPMFEADTGRSGDGEDVGDDAANDDANASDGGEMPTVESLAAELAQTRAALRRANKEAAERRKRLQAIEEAEAKRKEAELSEVEKAKKRAEEAEARLEKLQSEMEQQAIRHAMMIEASNLHFYNPEEAIRLADLSLVEIDDEGRVKGAKAALEALAKQSPYLIKSAGPGDINSQSGGRQRTPSVSDVIAAKRANGMYTSL